MPEPTREQLSKELERFRRRYERERRARSQAENIAERAILDLSRVNKEYERLFELSLSLLCTVDRDMRFCEVNPAWQKMLGWPIESLKGRSFLEFVHLDDQERTRAEATRLLEDEGTTSDFRIRLRHQDGRWSWLNWSASVSNNRIYASGTDVTEQILDQERLQASELRTRAILENTVDAIVTIDEQGIIAQANPSTERLFGYQTEELVGRNVSMLMPNPYREQHDRYLRSYKETGVAKIIGIGREVVAMRKDGTQFPVELSIGQVDIGSNRLFTGIIRDISARRLAEDRLKDAFDDLKKGRDDLLATLNQLRAKCMLINQDDEVVFLSAGGQQAGWPSTAQAIGKPWFEVVPGDRSTREIFRAMMRAEPSQRSRIQVDWRDDLGKQRWAEAEIKNDPRDQRSRVVFFYDVSELHELRERVSSATQSRMIGASPAMRTVFERIEDVARGDWTVLVEGETGTGKELVARAIHAASARRSGPFVAVNCAGLTDSLLESQLFGHRRGAFTGAVTDQEGLFESAAGGTLMLDEIGDVSPKLQASLLRVIQEGEIMRVGDTRVRKTDVRIVAATNRDLSKAVAEGTFREDLLYRIRVGRVVVPPLRERREDIPLLAAGFLAEQRLPTGKSVLSLAPDVERSLVTYSWPGNVRELKAAIEYATISAKAPVIGIGDLPPELASDPATPDVPLSSQRFDTDERAVGAATDERTRILAALEWAEGNRARAARKLGLSRATFYRRLDQFGISRKRP
jgi:PAS domain S-box-containing protein